MTGSGAPIEIYGISASNFVRAVRIVCEEKQLAYTLHQVFPHAPEVTAIHPFGKIPVMRHGDVELGESKAIATYLERTFPQAPLFPADTRGLAQMEQWFSLINTVIDRALIREYALEYVFARLEKREPNQIRIDAAVPAMQKQIELLEGAVADTGHLVGNNFTFADAILLASLAPLYHLPESAAALADAPNLRAYFTRHSERPSFVATTPDSLPS
ncbi:glutathione S-transferase [Rhodospirillales bacterium TMPK1]|uniref:Glutathione S-transferase n=2 Tax=Roseiterribacter gracilis TaxID=2812848 RepID=A0A8S8X7Y5_9PROT|nr:glutathione S-transferase [Rhodospirillales bacterium TMPK1]